LTEHEFLPSCWR